jgi:hypothetical protein
MQRKLDKHIFGFVLLIYKPHKIIDFIKLFINFITNS